MFIVFFFCHPPYHHSHDNAQKPTSTNNNNKKTGQPHQHSALSVSTRKYCSTMSSYRNLILIALVCAGAIPAVFSNSDGAPETACEDMTPQHGVPPQQSGLPYKLTVSSKQLDSAKSQPINLKLQGNGAGM